LQWQASLASNTKPTTRISSIKILQRPALEHRGILALIEKKDYILQFVKSKEYLK